jgi:hypothetical protein
LWDADEIRVVKVVALLLSMVTRKAGTMPIATFMGGNWSHIRALVRCNRTGWLLVCSTGRVAVTDDPEQLYRWQTTAKVSATVNLEALA